MPSQEEKGVYEHSYNTGTVQCKMLYLIHGEKSGSYCVNTLENEYRQTRNNAFEVQPTAHSSKVIFDNTAVGEFPPFSPSRLVKQG